MYKIFRNLLILATIMLCTITCVSANSEYSVIDGMITNYSGNADIVTVPAVIDGMEIAGIETNAFLNKDMHTVIIEEGIEVIQPKAFVGCENLEYVKSPESMLLINEDAFFECNMGMELDACDTTYIMYDMSDFSFFGAGIENYEEYTTGGTTTGGEETGDEEISTFLYSGNTITGYEGTATDIEIPDYIDGVKITTIGASAFQDNTVITSVVIPDTVTSIGAYAFKGCTSLEEVSLSKSLSSAGADTFMNCTSLKSITIPGTLKRIPKNMFYGCSGLIEAVLEEGVQNTGNYAFYNCRILKTISIPSTVQGIGVWSFGECHMLEEFKVPVGATYVDSAGFYRCMKLNEIILPDTVTSIGTHAFRGCSGLVNLRLSENISRIPYRALNGCGFSQIKIPQNVMHIDKESFYQCQQLKSIEIPEGVTEIGDSVFFGCSKLEDVEIPETVLSVGNGAFYGCSKLNMVIVYGADTTLGKIFSSGNNTNIGENTRLYVVANSSAENSAKEKELSYITINRGANVVASTYLLNGTENESGTRRALAEDDEVYVKYTIVNVSDEKQDMRLMICLYDENGQFLTYSYITDYVSSNKSKEIETDITVSESCYAKVILMDSISNLVPLFGAKEI